MIERLLEAVKPSGRTPRVNERIGDRLGKDRFCNMLRTGKRRQDSIAREELESANVQLVISAQGIV
jgi:hypothetical protein